jgi:hypothetical protein
VLLPTKNCRPSRAWTGHPQEYEILTTRAADFGFR